MIALPLTAFLFFCIALIYAAVGFAGGSSYLALLSFTDAPMAAIPVIALACNIIVSAGGSWHFVRQRHLRGGLLWPFAVPAIPFAYFGGRLVVAPHLLGLLTGGALLAAGLLLLAESARSEGPLRTTPGWPLCGLLGAALGFLAGLVGIGGGVFLAPLMLRGRWGRPKEVAAVSAVFILLNSCAGLAGQLSKVRAWDQAWPFAVLVGAALLGGQLGSWAGASRISQPAVRRITGLLVLLAGLRLLQRALSY